MAEDQKPAPKKTSKKKGDFSGGQQGEDALEKGKWGRDSIIDNDRYILTSDDKPHPNEEMNEARAATGADDAKNTGG